MISAPPKETPFFDKTGRISAIWVSWLQSLSAAGKVVENIVIQQSLNDDNSAAGNSGDVLDAANDALLLVSSAPAPPAGDGVLFDALGYADPMRVLVPLLEEISARLAASDGPVVLPVDVSPEFVGANGWIARCAELEALIVAGDPAPLSFLSAGVSGTLTIPKLTTANGSLTFTNGIITAFVQPT